MGRRKGSGSSVIISFRVKSGNLPVETEDSLIYSVFQGLSRGERSRLIRTALITYIRDYISANKDRAIHSAVYIAGKQFDGYVV